MVIYYLYEWDIEEGRMKWVKEIIGVWVLHRWTCWGSFAFCGWFGWCIYWFPSCNLRSTCPRSHHRNSSSVHRCCWSPSTSPSCWSGKGSIVLCVASAAFAFSRSFFWWWSWTPSMVDGGCCLSCAWIRSGTRWMRYFPIERRPWPSVLSSCCSLKIGCSYSSSIFCPVNAYSTPSFIFVV